MKASRHPHNDRGGCVLLLIIAGLFIEICYGVFSMGRDLFHLLCK